MVAKTKFSASLFIIFLLELLQQNSSEIHLVEFHIAADYTNIFATLTYTQLASVTFQPVLPVTFPLHLKSLKDSKFVLFVGQNSVMTLFQLDTFFCFNLEVRTRDSLAMPC